MIWQLASFVVSAYLYTNAKTFINFNWGADYGSRTNRTSG
jgi:hypothetical protein